MKNTQIKKMNFLRDQLLFSGTKTPKKAMFSFTSEEEEMLLKGIGDLPPVISDQIFNKISHHIPKLKVLNVGAKPKDLRFVLDKEKKELNLKELLEQLSWIYFFESMKLWRQNTDWAQRILIENNMNDQLEKVSMIFNVIEAAMAHFETSPISTQNIRIGEVKNEIVTDKIEVLNQNDKINYKKISLRKSDFSTDEKSKLISFFNEKVLNENGDISLLKNLKLLKELLRLDNSLSKIISSTISLHSESKNIVKIIADNSREIAKTLKELLEKNNSTELALISDRNEMDVLLLQIQKLSSWVSPYVLLPGGGSDIGKFCLSYLNKEKLLSEETDNLEDLIEIVVLKSFPDSELYIRNIISDQSYHSLESELYENDIILCDSDEDEDFYNDDIDDDDDSYYEEEDSEDEDCWETEDSDDDSDINENFWEKL